MCKLENDLERVSPPLATGLYMRHNPPSRFAAVVTHRRSVANDDNHAHRAGLGVVAFVKFDLVANPLTGFVP